MKTAERKRVWAEVQEVWRMAERNTRTISKEISLSKLSATSKAYAGDEGSINLDGTWYNVKTVAIDLALRTIITIVSAGGSVIGSKTVNHTGLETYAELINYATKNK